jgi:glycosyltransferase 2 family protein
LKKQQWIVALIAIAALAGLVFWGRDKIHFDFGVFRAQVAMADWRKIAFATGCIYIAYLFRAARWALLLRHKKKVPLFSLTGTQVIGFTAVALIGRVADPVRPYLVARRTGLSLSTQIAVYVIERLFDAGSMALIFSSVILITSWLGLAASLPHPEAVKKAALAGMVLTAMGALFLVAVRLYGNPVASLFEKAFGTISTKLGHAAAHKIRAFHAGLDMIRSFSDFAITATISISMWALISLAYLEATRAFTASPQLAHLSLPGCMLLLAVSGTASVFQLPVLGWFTQIGGVAATFGSFFGASPEASTACAAMQLLVTSLSVVPAGLVWARFEHVSLRKLAAESEHAEEELEIEEAPQ